jgi:protoheme IX farnesyltransferase
LFLIIFLWTPAHFWSLALFRASEYRQAGVPMMPAVRGPAATKRQMLAYTVLLLGASTAPYWLGAAGPAYLAGSLALGLALLVCAAACLAEPPAATRWARRTFRCSVVYLGALFPLLALSVRP